MRHEWWLDASDEDVATKGSVGVADVVEYRRKYGSLIKSGIAIMKEAAAAEANNDVD
jgi:hypothetical protein